jgi:hypothetical protein
VQASEDLIKNGEVDTIGSYYRGGWLNDSPTGKGVWESAGCDMKYIGGVLNGHYHGRGVLAGALPYSFSTEFPSPSIRLDGDFKVRA